MHASDRAARVGFVFVSCAALAACSGGGSVPHASPPMPTTTQAIVPGHATIIIPTRTAASQRHIRFVSASAVSLALSVNGSAPVYADVSATSPNCTTGASGRSCIIPVSAPAGSVLFGGALFDAPNGAGNVLAAGTATQTVVIGVPFSVGLALSGLIANVTITVPQIDIGPTSVPVVVTAKDADGNTISGSAPYPTPITLTNSDATGTLALSSTTVNSPNDRITLVYTGQTLAAPATISATLALPVIPTRVPLPTPTIVPAAVMPLNYFPTGLTLHYASTRVATTTFVPVGSAQPPAPQTPTTTVATPSATVLGPGTYNGVATAFSIALPERTSYFAFQNGTVYDLGSNLQSAASTYAITYAKPVPIYDLPFVPGASTQSIPALSYTNAIANPRFGNSQIQQTIDASGKLHVLQTFADGSTFIEDEAPDGVSTESYSAGTDFTFEKANGFWQSGLDATLTSAAASLSSPSSGTVAVNVTQTGPGGTQNASVAFPTSSLYPNLVPKGFFYITTSVGTPVATAPAPCAVNVAYAAPVVPTTETLTQWDPAFFLTSVRTETSYHAPGVGIICRVATAQTTSAPDLAPNPFPLPGGFLLNVMTVTKTTSLTSIATAADVGRKSARLDRK